MATVREAAKLKRKIETLRELHQEASSQYRNDRDKIDAAYKQLSEQIERQIIDIENALDIKAQPATTTRSRRGKKNEPPPPPAAPPNVTVKGGHVPPAHEIAEDDGR